MSLANPYLAITAAAEDTLYGTALSPGTAADHAARVQLLPRLWPIVEFHANVQAQIAECRRALGFEGPQ